MSTITWLHLSDLHFRATEQQKWDADIVLSALLEDVVERTKQNDLRPDFIIITGDIAFSGKPEEYSLARGFFDELLKVTTLHKGQLFLVPGNHDVDRSLVSFPAKATAKELTDHTSTNEVLTKSENRELMFARFRGYAAFVNDYFGRFLSFDDERYFYVRRLELDHSQVAIVGLNSAWLAQGDEDRNQLVLGDRQVRTALDASKGADLRIVFMHHPFDWLRDFDRENCEELLTRGCDFILHGHLHRTGLILQQTPDARSMIIAAGASYETRQSDNSYNLVQFDLETGTGTVLLRAWSDRQDGFWTSDTRTYRNVPDGAYSFKLVKDLRPKEDFTPTRKLVADTAPETLRAAYLNRLFETTKQFYLAGIDPRAAGEKVGIHLALGALYTPLLTLGPETQEYVTRGQAPGEEARSLSALAQLDRYRYLVLQGDPGSGKSTFVNFVTMCLAGEALGRAEANLALLTAPLPDERGRTEREGQTWRHGPLLPVRILLRDLVNRGLTTLAKPATAEVLCDFLTADLQAGPLADYAPYLLSELLERGGLLLLDGLDEVPESGGHREQIRQMIRNFAATFQHCRILVTSRPYAYCRQEWQPLGFVTAILAPFHPGQVRQFVDRWYAYSLPLRGSQMDANDLQAELLKRAIFGSDRLYGLAKRPLLLTLITSLHIWRGGSLQDKREEIYAAAVELLLNWWEGQRVGRDEQGNMVLTQSSLTEWLRVDQSKIRDWLNELAFVAHRDQPSLSGTADITKPDLVNGLFELSQNPAVNPNRLMEYLRDRVGLFLPRTEGVYTLFHRIFQEYLAACYLTDHEYPDLLAELARQDPDRWREVALLAGAKATRGMATAIWLMVDALCFREPDATDVRLADSWGALVAGQALVESADLRQIGETYKPKIERVQRWLVHVLERGRLSVAERIAAGRALAHLGDPRRNVMTLDEMDYCYVPPGPFWMGEGAYAKLKDQIYYGYWIARYPVTNAQFSIFVNADGYRMEKYWRILKRKGFWKKPGMIKMWNDDIERHEPYDFGEPFNLPNHPVVGVSWYEAVAFTSWMTDWLNQVGMLPKGWQVRLPTEAEWEKSARGGVEIPNDPLIGQVVTPEDLAMHNNPVPQRHYPWGEQCDPDHANYEDSAVGTTNAVGCFAQASSPYGVDELSGSIWEWTYDLWKTDLKGNGLVEGLGDLKTSGLRVLRGGSFLDSAGRVRCTHRVRSNPYGYGMGHGFRVVVVPV